VDRKRLFRYMRYTALAIMAFGAAYAVFLYITKPSSIQSSLINSTRINKQPQPLSVLPLGEKAADLYFKDKDMAFLGAETRELVHPENSILLGKAILEMLIKGPEQGLVPTIPPHTGLNAFYIAEDGTAYADLTENIQTDHPGGSTTEMITIYSIVNSLVLNIPEVKQVKILINGQEAMTLAGHIDIRNPFKANMLMVR
jgi:spore germination protein GerM